MQLAWSPEDEAFRGELIAFLDERTPEQMRTGFDFQDVRDEHELVPRWLRDWQATLFDHGWMIPGYPPERGGRNCTPVQTLIYLEELSSRSRRYSLSMLVPMGQEMAYRYQEELIHQTLAALRTFQGRA